MSIVRRLMSAGALVGLALALWGCGAGDLSPFQDFFGGGTSPGSSFSEAKPGRIEGWVYRREVDNRILVLGAKTDAAGQPLVPAEPDLRPADQPASPVKGATVTLKELQISGPTGADGFYVFTELQPGTYTLNIKLPDSLGGGAADFSIRIDPGQTVSGLPLAGELF